jgi:hypothetical protein
VTSGMSPDEAAEYGSPVTQLGRPADPSARRSPGRPGRPKKFYAKLALEYERIEHGTRRDLGKSTREVLARRHKVPITTIGKWLQQARQRGFITKGERGQRGGNATDLARVIAQGTGRS